MGQSVRVSWAGVRRGARALAPVSVGMAAFGLVHGVLALQTGLSLAETVLMNVFVYSGAAQTAVLESWTYPVPIAGAVLTTVLINLRLVLLGAALRPWLAPVPPGIVYPAMHSLSDESWATTMNAHRRGERDVGFLIGANLTGIAAWIPSTVLGFVVGGRLPEPERIGLDFVFTVIFAALLFGGYRGRFDLLPWTAAATVAIVTSVLVPGSWYVLAGGLTGFGLGMMRGRGQ